MTLAIATYLMLCFLQGLKEEQENLLAGIAVLYARHRVFHGEQGELFLGSGACQKP